MPVGIVLHTNSSWSLAAFSWRFWILVFMLITNTSSLQIWDTFLFVSTRRVALVYVWQSQVENEHYSTVYGLLRLVISLECFIEITPDFLCPFMND